MPSLQTLTQLIELSPPLTKLPLQGQLRSPQRPVELLPRAIGGPEALAAFYLLAFTAAPLVYFGLHWLAGFLAGLARKDALAIGLSGLLMLLVPVLLASRVHPWLLDLANPDTFRRQKTHSH